MTIEFWQIWVNSAFFKLAMVEDQLKATVKQNPFHRKIAKLMEYRL